MKKELTKQDILNLFAETDKRFDKRLEKERADREKSFAKSRKEFDKRLGEITDTWGKFVEGMVSPSILNLMRDRGIKLKLLAQRIKGIKNGQTDYEIDLMGLNDTYVIAVEVKSKLNVYEVNKHLERLKKIQSNPPHRFDFKGLTILGAVAGMIIEQDADKYAIREGLFVLKQKGNLIEIANDADFKPKEWKVK